MRALEPWVAAPLQTFITESSARLILLMTTSGQVVAQHGFSRSVDVMTAAALGAGDRGIHRGIGPHHGAPRFAALVHGGNRQSCMLSAVRHAPRPLDRTGGVRVRDVGRPGAAVLRPDGGGAGRPRRRGSSRSRPPLAENFERELNTSLKELFGR